MRWSLELCAGVAAAICAALTVGCGREDQESSACAAAVMIDDVPYIGTTIPAGRRVTLGAPVKGISPRCNDGGGPEPDVDAQVASIAGVPVAVAVVEPNAPQAVYLAPDYLPDLASHLCESCCTAESVAGSTPGTVVAVETPRTSAESSTNATCSPAR